MLGLISFFAMLAAAVAGAMSAPFWATILVLAGVFWILGILANPSLHYDGIRTRPVTAIVMQVITFSVFGALSAIIFWLGKFIGGFFS